MSTQRATPTQQQRDDQRTRHNSTRPLNTLQRHSGNQALQRLVRHGIAPKLTVNTPGDRYEREADRVARQVTRSPTPQLRRACDCGGTCSACREEEQHAVSETAPRVQATPTGTETVPDAVPSAVVDALASPGRPLSAESRESMESRFGHDFSGVRVQTGPQADTAAASVGARAFTVGSTVVFRTGEFSPHTHTGRHLLAHELTHVVQQRAAPRLADGPSPQPTSGSSPSDASPRRAQRHSEQERVRQTAPTTQIQRETPAAAEPADPLCATYDYAAKKTAIEGHVTTLKATPDVETRLTLIREVKWIVRCGTAAQKTEIQTLLETGLGTETGKGVWEEAGQPFGGYRGVYPGYYGGAKGRLKRLGTSEIEGYAPLSRGRIGSDPHRKRSAKAEAPTLTATDILYFYGHQFAQYNHPGVFSNGTFTQWVDLRTLAAEGDFKRVKLVVSTSCATICKEALAVFTALFPNAVILGYRKSAPEQGEAVRNDFDTAIRDLKRPLLLEESVDVEAIISAWKSVIERRHPNESRRLPGYYKNGTVHYLESGTWNSMAGSDAANSCRKKGSTLDEATN